MKDARGRQSPVTHSAITPSFRKSILIRQVSPHVVEIAVPGCTGGIVAHTAEEPELAIAVDPVRRIAAATRSPYLVRLVWAYLIAINAVGGTRVRALDPGPRAGLASGRVRSVYP